MNLIFGEDPKLGELYFLIQIYWSFFYLFIITFHFFTQELAYLWGR